MGDLAPAYGNGSNDDGAQGVPGVEVTGQVDLRYNCVANM